MSFEEEQIILRAIKENAPQWYIKIKKNVAQKRSMITKCVEVSCNENYQEEINKIINSSQVYLNDQERILLNYICLIKHKEYLNNHIDRDDPEIQKWISILCKYTDIESTSTSIISILYKLSLKTINQYKVRNKIGRPKGCGKQVFSYNGEEYHTIQECADRYGISKPGMYKKLKQLQII